MNLAFVDIVYGYTADRPDSDSPLGGTTSAICFLARELRSRGINCTFYNTISVPGSAEGIQSLPLSALADPHCYEQHTAFIFCGRWLEGMVKLIRSHTSAPLIAWMHESQFTPSLVPPLDAFDAVVFVSEWQKRVNAAHTKPHWQQTVIRNAMNPKAAHIFSSPSLAANVKAQPPELIYAGSFARGAFHIADILDHLRMIQPDFTMKIFCNLSPSGHAPSDEAYIAWLRQQKNVTHVGMVGQSELLQHMKSATAILMPNPWPETSCITLIEAMATGLHVITTDRAALPETASGYATLIPIDQADDPIRFDMAIDHKKFAQTTAAILADIRQDPLKNAQRLQAQIDYFHRSYQWSHRAASWFDFLKDIG